MKTTRRRNLMTAALFGTLAFTTTIARDAGPLDHHVGHISEAEAMNRKAVEACRYTSSLIPNLRFDSGSYERSGREAALQLK